MTKADRVCGLYKKVINGTKVKLGIRLNEESIDLIKKALVEGRTEIEIWPNGYKEAGDNKPDFIMGFCEPWKPPQRENRPGGTDFDFGPVPETQLDDDLPF